MKQSLLMLSESFAVYVKMYIRPNDNSSVLAAVRALPAAVMEGRIRTFV